MTTKQKQLTADILQQNHQRLKELFLQYEKAAYSREKEMIVDMISLEFRAHAALEEQLLFPEAQKFLSDDSLIRDAMHDHMEITMILDQLMRLFADQDHAEYDTAAKKLRKAIDQHIIEAKEKILPCIENSGLNLNTLGEEIQKYNTGTV